MDSSGDSGLHDDLQSLCRLCGNEIKRRRVPKMKLAPLIRKATSIDVTEDKTDTHPSSVCEPCEQALNRWNKKNKHKSTNRRSEFPIKLKEFNDAGPIDSMSDLFSMCEDLATEHKLLFVNLGNSVLLIAPDKQGNSKLCCTVEASGMWHFSVYGRNVPKTRSPLKALPERITVKLLPHLVNDLTTWHVCPGNPDLIVQESVLRNKPAYLHYLPDSSTVRHESCPMISTNEGRCDVCKMYRSDLAAVYKRCNVDASPAPKTNFKHIKHSKLTKRLKASKARGKMMKRKIDKLEARITQLFEEEAIKIDKINCDAFKEVFLKESKTICSEFPANSPQHLLWEEQKKSLSRNPKGVRWHPAIIRLCIALSAKSPAAYELLRTSGFLTLPTQRTLRCYTNFTASEAGFNKEFLARVCEDINLTGLGEIERNIMLAFDEMKVFQGLVYSHQTGLIIGFTSLGSAGDEMAAFARKCEGEDPQMASHALVLMARGICTSFCRAVAYFATGGATTDQLYHVIMEGTEYLETCGFSVRGLVCDGAASNRGLFKLLTKSSPEQHTFTNPFTGKPMYLFSDVPHLLKTTRNNLENSGFNSNSRNMKFRGLDVSWKHLLDVYEWDMRGAAGLRMLHRITEEHLRLTPTHRMKVKLAAQVLSSTMANALRVQGNPATESTRMVIDYFNQFFDCLNVSSRYEGTRKRNPSLQPYTDVNDWRFTWLKEDFLGFLEEWETEANVVDLTASEREKLHLSRQTLEGIRMTVNSFINLTCELLAEGAEYILSEKFSQDPLEEYFSKQRGIGGGNDNPSVSQFGSNMLTLQVAGECIRASKRANVTSSGSLCSVDNTPIPRKRLFKK